MMGLQSLQTASQFPVPVRTSCPLREGTTKGETTGDASLVKVMSAPNTSLSNIARGYAVVQQGTLPTTSTSTSFPLVQQQPSHPPNFGGTVPQQFGSGPTPTTYLVAGVAATTESRLPPICHNYQFHISSQPQVLYVPSSSFVFPPTTSTNVSSISPCVATPVPGMEQIPLEDKNLSLPPAETPMDETVGNSTTTPSSASQPQGDGSKHKQAPDSNATNEDNNTSRQGRNVAAAPSRTQRRPFRMGPMRQICNLHESIATGSASTAIQISTLIQREPDALYKTNDHDGSNALHIALRHRASSEAVEALLAAVGIEHSRASNSHSIPLAQQRDRRGNFPIHTACQWGYFSEDASASSSFSPRSSPSSSLSSSASSPSSSASCLRRCARRLIQSNPEALLTRNFDGQLPIDIVRGSSFPLDDAIVDDIRAATSFYQYRKRRKDGDSDAQTTADAPLASQEVEPQSQEGSSGTNTLQKQEQQLQQLQQQMLLQQQLMQQQLQIQQQQQFQLQFLQQQQNQNQQAAVRNNMTTQTTTIQSPAPSAGAAAAASQEQPAMSNQREHRQQAQGKIDVVPGGNNFSGDEANHHREEQSLVAGTKREPQTILQDNQNNAFARATSTDTTCAGVSTVANARKRVCADAPAPSDEDFHELILLAVGDDDHHHDLTTTTNPDGRSNSDEASSNGATSSGTAARSTWHESV